MNSGLVIVDKPAGWTSHDVVGRLRRLAQTRKVGHAGTLDPMATGVLVIGVNRATRLLGYLQLADKEYTATIRLGQSTLTDDAEGDVTAEVPANHVTEADIRSAMTPLTGDISQVPSSVSAIKVNGERSYARVRAGERVELKARPVTVSEFELHDVREIGQFLDLDVRITCSSGTYVRAIARDLGVALGVGGHLTALRRTRVGGFGLETARTLEQLAEDLRVIPLAETARTSFPVFEADQETARNVRYGRKLSGIELGASGPVAVMSFEGEFLALYEQTAEAAEPVAVFAAAG